MKESGGSYRRATLLYIYIRGRDKEARPNGHILSRLLWIQQYDGFIAVHGVGRQQKKYFVLGAG